MTWYLILLIVISAILVALVLIDITISLLTYHVMRQKAQQSERAYEKIKKDLGIVTDSEIEFLVHPDRFGEMLSACFAHNGFPRYRIVLLFLRLKAVIRLYKKEKILQTGAAAGALTTAGELAAEIGNIRNGVTTKPVVKTDVAFAGLQVVRLYMMGYSKKQAFAAPRFDSALRVDNALNGSFYKYQCADGRYFSAHVYYESQKAKLMKALGIETKPAEFNLDSLKGDKKVVAAAIKNYKAEDLEKLAFDCGACGCVLRTHEEWKATDFGQAVCAMPLIRTAKVGDSPKKNYGPCGSDLPLKGIKVLDLTHIIAGPACSRILAEYGADVLLVRRGKFLEQEQAMLELDGWAGKNSIQLDFNVPEQLELCKKLIKEADVVTYSYQNGALDHFGLSREAIHELNPNIIYGSLMCFSDSVWKDKPGWAPLAEDVTGLSIRNGSLKKPKNLNGVPLDYIPGFMLAIGVLNAIKSNLLHGGAYNVTGSLTRTAEWLHEVSDDEEKKVPFQTKSRIIRASLPLFEEATVAVKDTVVGPLLYPTPATVVIGLPSSVPAMAFQDGRTGFKK
ncbi:MAG: Formyl-coenzyme A transferase [Tenericutes bacterium ADurb.BinA155]|nr:MAG: Formyl-coenzyme A transferase [Tenericutes bacterium ADurb.BinA155]